MRGEPPAHSQRRMSGAYERRKQGRAEVRSQDARVSRLGNSHAPFHAEGGRIRGERAARRPQGESRVVQNTGARGVSHHCRSAGMTRFTVDRLLEPFSFPQFCDAYYGKQPLSIRRLAPEYYDGLITLDSLNADLGETGLVSTELRLVRNGEHLD